MAGSLAERLGELALIGRKLTALVAKERKDRLEREDEQRRREHLGSSSEPVEIGRVLPLTLASVFRRHLWRHPAEKWRIVHGADGARLVRLTCSCETKLVLPIGAHVCPLEGCDRVWFWTGLGVFHAHPEQLATDQAA